MLAILKLLKNFGIFLKFSFFEIFPKLYLVFSVVAAVFGYCFYDIAPLDLTDDHLQAVLSVL